MTVFERLAGEYEQVVFGHDPQAGLRAIVAVYSTARGPALGGTRMRPYATEDEALEDVLRLGKAMAFKAAGAGLPLGGGKAVIIGDPETDKSPELFAAYARVVDRMAGSYVTTADAGTTVEDLDEIAKHTRHVTGTSAGSGDPSPNTAHGVFHSMLAVAERTFGEPSLKGRSVVVSGVGKVGHTLVELLADEGATLTISDVRPEVVAEVAAATGATLAPAEVAHAVECDIYAPCAFGPAVTAANLGDLRCGAIVGAANNQLETPDLADALAARGIVYAPDYIVNAGGLINVAEELQGYDAGKARAKAVAIADTVREIFALADQEGLTPAEAADRICAARIARASAGSP